MMKIQAPPQTPKTRSLSKRLQQVDINNSRKNKITEKDIIRQIREVLKHNPSMDVFICLKDKKTENISTFTSDKTSFSLKTVAKLVRM